LYISVSNVEFFQLFFYILVIRSKCQGGKDEPEKQKIPGSQLPPTYRIYALGSTSKLFNE